MFVVSEQLSQSSALWEVEVSDSPHSPHSAILSVFTILDYLQKVHSKGMDMLPVLI